MRKCFLKLKTTTYGMGRVVSFMNKLLENQLTV